ncbi:hypothetical protein QTP88_005505 [Uroleucon formosanum]
MIVDILSFFFRKSLGNLDYCGPYQYSAFIKTVPVFLTALRNMSVKQRITQNILHFGNFLLVSILAHNHTMQDKEHQHIEELKHSEETEKFTCIFNSVFDALNCRYPAEEIRSSCSKDIQVLEETTSWLNDWESHVIKGNIKKDEFLANSTANGLRITMKSTIDLLNFLLQTCGFKYVLTNKMNQDRMEQFFGTTRQSIGPNDHPTCPSFLQVYKLLTMYSIIKPPKTGNCQILDPSTFMIQLSHLFKNEPSERQIKIERLKRLLDAMVEESDWNSNQIKKHTKCNVCLSAFKGTDRDAQLPETALTNLKPKGYLLYPNKQFFKLITAIERFVKFSILYNNEDETIYISTKQSTTGCCRSASEAKRWKNHP